MNKLTYISILEECRNEVIDKRLNGISINDIAKQYNVSRDTVNYFMRKHEVITRQYRNTNEDVKRNVLEKTNGRFVYLSGYKNKESRIRIRCNKCGCESELTYHHLTTAKSKCRYCDSKEIERKTKRIQKERAKIIKAWNRPSGKQMTMRVCKECGAVFIDSRKGYCSDKCKRKRINRNKDNRLNKANVIDRDITLTKLYQRDNGKCYLCGIVCDWNDKIIDDNGAVIVGATYPTIEHIQPLSKGGLHKWDNVKISCKKCNELKGNTPPIAL